MLSDTRRIEREIRQVRQDSSANLTVEVVDDNLCHLLGTLQGPANSPYAGGTFQLDIVLPTTYPFVPPKMRFITPVYHPNVSSVTGAICLDILKDEWTPVLTLKTVMISLQSLLCDPVPDNPQDAEVASHYMRDRKGFDQTARQWTEIHAIPSATSPSVSSSPAPRPPAAQTASAASSAADPPALKTLIEMGFSRELVSRALQQSDGSESRALEALLANNVQMHSPWTSLGVAPGDLQLKPTLNGGQSFRWRATGDGEWTSVLRGRIISLRQAGVDSDVWFKSHNRGSVPEAQAILHDYFQLGVDLKALYARWNQDVNFKKKAGTFAGIRVLRQDPTENVFSFICSSNNNISRITSMVAKMAERYGTLAGTSEDDGHAYYNFPTVARLAEPGVEDELRKLGFGYRARYIAESARYILANHDESWLESLRDREYTECKEELMKLSGVGPKVADCVCLMSMDQHGAIPVDTHVWQIAKRDYRISGLANAKTMTAKNYLAIGDFFRALFGSHAGWAHSVLFTADLRQIGPKSEPLSVIAKNEIVEAMQENENGLDRKVLVKKEVKVTALKDEGAPFAENNVIIEQVVVKKEEVVDETLLGPRRSLKNRTQEVPDSKPTKRKKLK